MDFYEDLAAPVDSRAMESSWKRANPAGQVDFITFPSGSRLRLWNFRVNGIELKPEHQRALTWYARRLVRRAVSEGLRQYVVIQGHASRSGSLAFNLSVSSARAQSISRYLETAIRAALAGQPPAQAARLMELFRRRLVVRAAGSNDPMSQNL